MNSDADKNQARRGHWPYAFALLGASVLMFDIIAVVVGLLMLTFWACVFYSKRRPTAFVIASIFGIFISPCLYTSLISVGTSRQAARRSICSSNLKIIGIALHNYHEQYGTFPPAVIADNKGQPLYSWRVLILPLLDKKSLYDEFRLDEPWDSEDNRKLLEKMPWEYACPTYNSGKESGCSTSYVAVVDSECMWSGQRARSLADIRDGTSNTLMVVEHNALSIPWTAPRDIDLQEAVNLLGSNGTEVIGIHHQKAYFFEYIPWRHSILADGSIFHAPAGLSPELAMQVLQTNDGGPPDNWRPDPRHAKPPRRLNVFNVFRCALFILLVALPLPWVFLKPRRRVLA